MIKVREGTLNDVDRLMLFVYELQMESPYYLAIEVNIDKVIERLISCVTDDRMVLVIAEDSEDQIVGGLAGFITSYWFSDELVSGDFSFFVTKEMRGYSAAKQLVRFYVDWAMRGGVKPHNIQMGVTTGVNPGRTSKFLRKLGFFPLGELFVFGGHYGS